MGYSRNQQRRKKDYRRKKKKKLLFIRKGRDFQARNLDVSFKWLV